jgi:hypothetical protein
VKNIVFKGGTSPYGTMRESVPPSFEPERYPKDEDDVDAFGRDDLNNLLDHYAEPKTVGSVTHEPLVSRAGVTEEFLLFKRLAHTERYYVDSSGKKHFRTPMQLFAAIFESESRRKIFKNTYKLMTACCYILVCNAECERCFSCCNRIKTSLRNRLKASTLDKLVRIAYSSHTIHTFDFEAAATHWLSTPRRI